MLFESEIFVCNRSEFIIHFLAFKLVLFGFLCVVFVNANIVPIRKIMRKEVLVFRLNGGGTKASNTFGTAKFSGTKGNDIKIAVSVSVDNTENFDVETYIGTTLVDSQTVASSAQLKDNDFVVFDKTVTLAETAGETMSGGTNGTALAHETFLSQMESFSCNAIGVTSEDSSVVKLYAAFAKMMRNDYGIKFQIVAYNYAADSECVINVKNKPEAVYWVLGVEAGIAVNKSALNMVYDGEFDVPADMERGQRALVLVEARERVELGIALRGGEGHGAEGVYGPDGDPVAHPPEAVDLRDGRVEAELELVEAERQGPLGDRRAVVDLPVAPVRGKRQLHGKSILSTMNESTASSLIDRSHCR